MLSGHRFTSQADPVNTISRLCTVVQNAFTRIAWFLFRKNNRIQLSADSPATLVPL